MHRTEIFAVNLGAFAQKQNIYRRWKRAKQLLIADKCNLVSDKLQCTAKIKWPKSRYHILDAKIKVERDSVYLSIPNFEAFHIQRELDANELMLVVVEGVNDAVTIILYFSEDLTTPFEEVGKKDPTLRLNSFDLPPIDITHVDNIRIASAIYNYIATSEPDLLSINAQRFLNSTHILSHLFVHSANLASQESIVFLEKLRILSDKLRPIFEKYIFQIERDHHNLWSEYQGAKISFADGGMSRIIALPGVTPTGLRVGVYSVVPGETEAAKREDWSMYPYLVGDVLNDRSILDYHDQTDEKRFLEAARYICELISTFDFVKQNHPHTMFLHGPIQNSFETYAETDPYFIPGVSEEFLDSMNFDRKLVATHVRDIPKNSEGRVLWNSPIAIYLAVSELLRSCNVPIVGVVERAASSALTREMLKRAEDDGDLTKGARRAVLKEMKKFDIRDELLFGCILGIGECISPVKLQKNLVRRARDRWQGVVRQFSPVHATMIKTSDHSFPFRVEFAADYGNQKFIQTMSLIYHTSLLLPNYAFPVGLDIADKYAKIPDWLSRGVSTHLAAVIYKRCVQSGDVALLNQMRNLLGRSPRDFYYRPTAK